MFTTTLNYDRSCAAPKEHGNMWHFFQTPGLGTPAWSQAPEHMGPVRSVTLDHNQWAELGQPQQINVDITAVPA